MGSHKDVSKAARALKILSPICIRPASADPHHYPTPCNLQKYLALPYQRVYCNALQCTAMYLCHIRSLSPTNAPCAHGISQVTCQCDRKVASVIGDIAGLGCQHRILVRDEPVSCMPLALDSEAQGLIPFFSSLLIAILSANPFRMAGNLLSLSITAL